MPFLRSLFFPLITVSAFAQSNTQPVTPKFDGQSLWNYVKILGDDNMEGRDTGSKGLKRAEAYVVEQLLCTLVVSPQRFPDRLARITAA